MHDDNASTVGVRIEIVVIYDPLNTAALLACVTEKKGSTFVALAGPPM